MSEIEIPFRGAMDFLRLEFWTATPEDVQRLAIVLGAASGVVLGIWRIWATNRTSKAAKIQADLATQQHIIELLRTSLENLESERRIERLTAYLTLERLAKDHKAERPVALQMLSDHLTELVRSFELVADGEKETQSLSAIEDIKRVYSIIGTKTSLWRYVPIVIRGIDFVRNNFIQFRNEPFAYEHCRFPPIKFENETLHWVKFDSCKFEQIHLSKCNIHFSHFVLCEMRNAVFEKCNFTGSSMRDCDLTGASFRNAFFKGADFTKSNLAKADFSFANTHNDATTVFEDCNLEGVDFSGGNFVHSKGLSEKVVENSRHNQQTRWPRRVLVGMQQWNFKRGLKYYLSDW